MPLTKIKSLGITDGTIVNDDISASAAIASTKLSGVANTPAFYAFKSDSAITSGVNTKLSIPHSSFQGSPIFPIFKSSTETQ